MRKRSKKPGLPPGTLIHVGEQKTEAVRISGVRYDARTYQHEEFSAPEAVSDFPAGGGVVWINLTGMHDVKTVERLGQLFQIHPLTLEDVLNTDHPPKSEDFENYIFIVIKMLYYNGAIQAEQLSLVLGPDFLLSFQESPQELFDPVRERIRKGRSRIRGAGADYLAYALCDAVTDHYFIVLERFTEIVEELEDAILENRSFESLERIHGLRRELATLRRWVRPLREITHQLVKADSPLLSPETSPYFKDVYDHAIQVLEGIDALKETLAGLQELHLSLASHRMNEVMKVLTVIATIFIPLTFIAGIYGMNFEYMPELKWRWGYFFIWGLMLALALLMIIWFRKRKWM